MKYLLGILVCLFAGVQAQSNYVLSVGTEARFYIDEVLLGKPKTVIGVTSEVTGEVSFDLANPQAAQLGIITIASQNFVTDDNRRNGQIRNRVLESGQYPSITFEATAIAGLPTAVAVGDTFRLEITGNLTIKETTKEVVFVVDVTVVSESELQGLGSTLILFADYGVSIPRVPLVAGTDEEVKLELAFSAIAN